MLTQVQNNTEKIKNRQSPFFSTLFKIQLIMLSEKSSKLGQIVLHLLWTEVYITLKCYCLFLLEGQCLN